MLGIELMLNDCSNEVILTHIGLIEPLAMQYAIVGIRISMPQALHYFATESDSQPTNIMKY
jgi:hypothetical protein